MDNFIDKLAQKFTAGEVIKANSAAEERELKKLREQVAEYERCLQEMRKIQMTNTQSAQNLHDLLVETSESLRKLTGESVQKISDLKLETDAERVNNQKTIDTAVTAVEQMEEKALQMQKNVQGLTEQIEKNQKKIEEWFKQADDFLHKENVKVYRNVQAVVVEEVGNKAEAVIKAQEEKVKAANKPVLIFAVLGFLAALAGLLLQIFEATGIPLF